MPSLPLKCLGLACVVSVSLFVSKFKDSYQNPKPNPLKNIDKAEIERILSKLKLEELLDKPRDRRERPRDTDLFRDLNSRLTANPPKPLLTPDEVSDWDLSEKYLEWDWLDNEAKVAAWDASYPVEKVILIDRITPKDKAMIDSFIDVESNSPLTWDRNVQDY